MFTLVLTSIRDTLINLNKRQPTQLTLRRFVRRIRAGKRFILRHLSVSCNSPLPVTLHSSNCCVTEYISVRHRSLNSVPVFHHLLGKKSLLWPSLKVYNSGWNRQNNPKLCQRHFEMFVFSFQTRKTSTNFSCHRHFKPVMSHNVSW